MSETVNKTMIKKPALALGQFADPGALVIAARKVRGAGYKDFDTHSPFAIHGMDQATGEGQSPLGWIVGLMAFIGGGGAILLQWWTSAVEYPLVISGKEFFSYQAFVPITFELTVLLSSFGAVLGMFALNRIPRLYNPIFNSERFEKATDDGFFISIEASDPKFDPTQTAEFLKSIGAVYVETVEEEVEK